MTTLALYARLRDLGVHLSVQGNQLAYDAPAGVVTGEVLAELRAHKAALIQALSRPSPTALEEADEYRPPPNPTVHAMFDEALRRFGTRALEERSLTVWLRAHAPRTAALWPEAPVDASWFDWRRRVPPEAVPDLDAALGAVVAQRREVRTVPGPEPRPGPGRSGECAGAILSEGGRQ